MKEVKIIKEQCNEFEAKVKSTSKYLEDLEASSSTEYDHPRTSRGSKSPFNSTVVIRRRPLRISTN